MPETGLYPLTLALSPPLLGEFEPILGPLGENVAAGTAWSKVDTCENRKIRRFFEPRPIEAGPFIFLYEIAAVSLNWTEKFEKGRSAALGPLVAYRASE